MQLVYIFSQCFYYLSISLLMHDDDITFGMSTAGLTECPEGCWQTFCAINLSFLRW